MKRLLTLFLTKILSLVNAYPTASTDKQLIKSLLIKLSPVCTDKNLIRLGPNGDGGYLVPDDLDDIEACFSPGVSDISGFEKDCANLGMKVFMADRSVDHPIETHEKFKFTKKYVGITTNKDFMTIDDWVRLSLPKSEKDLILQIDVESYEYEIFIGMSDSLLKRFRIIVVEFHGLHQLWNKPFFSLSSRVFDKLLQTHKCVHIHPNNQRKTITKGGVVVPQLAEFTFLRNDRITNSSPAKVFPHTLDFDNTNKPHMPLPRCWYNK